MFGNCKSRRPVWLWPIITFLSLQMSGGILYIFRPRPPLFLQSLGGDFLYIDSPKLPDWMVYNLPDGLFCLSFILLIMALWRPQHAYALIFCSLFYAGCMLSEGIQYFSWFSGTYDPLDLFFYSLAALVAWGIYIHHLPLKYQNV